MGHPLIARAWIGSGRATTVLPDGCADLVWTGGRLVVAGPATQPVDVEATPGQPRFGVRLRAGGIEAALGVPAALRDVEVPVDALWGRGAADGVARAAYGARTFARVQRFQRLLLLAAPFPGAPLAQLARAAGETSESFKTPESRGRILTA